jgi:hypothetical protein
MNPDEELTPEERINRLLSEAYVAIAAAEIVADEHNLGFGWELAYGMGGYYDGAEGEWNSSTSNCS